MTSESFEHQPGASVSLAEGIRAIPRSPNGQTVHAPVLQNGLGDGGMSCKLKALVQLDIEGARARIGIRGSVNTRNIQALYIMARRANSLAPGLEIVIDLKQSTVQPEAMEELLECSAARRLPHRIDPDRFECLLPITPAARLARTPTGLALAA